MLSDLLRPRLCELGKIKIGGLGEERTSKAGNAYRAPEKHDYFTVTTMLRDAKGDLIPDAELMSALKEYESPDGKLRQLPISLLSNDLDDVMQAAYVWYNGKRLAARGDGKTLTRHFDATKGWLPQPDVKPWKPEFADLAGPDGKKLFKLHVTLNCVVAAPLARWGGVYKFRSTSQITADQLYGSFIQLRTLTGGQLRGLPLRLVVRPVQVAPEGKPITVYVVHAELRGPDLQAIQELALQRARYEIDNAKQLGALQQEYKQLLAAPGDGETPEEQAEIAAEFHPEPEPAVSPNAVTGQPDEAKPAEPVNNSPESFESNFAAGIEQATTEDALNSIVTEMRAAFDRGWIREPHRARLAQKVKGRRSALASKS